MSDSFRCVVVTKSDEGVSRSIEDRSVSDLPEGDVRIGVAYSSVNYKDALAATGHPGVARNFPHVPGIDAAGEVIESTAPEYSPGDQVLVTGRDLGVGQWGGWASQIRVPSDWVIPLPDGLTAQESMALGTAGFTAAQCVSSLIEHGVDPDGGDVLLTGATGGVGSLAVRLLALLGYSVVAATGKADQHDQLRDWGARDVVPRDDVSDDSDRPLLKGRWAGSVDTVGGKILATTLRSMSYRGCVAACGLTAGPELNTTVYPFILRGVSLVGIDSAACPFEPRKRIWRKLSTSWKLPNLVEETNIVTLEDLEGVVTSILAGELVGRYLVDCKC